MKKATVLLTALSLLVMACTCPLTSIFESINNPQASVEEGLSDLAIALTEEAMQEPEQDAESLPTDIPEVIPNPDRGPDSCSRICIGDWLNEDT